MNLIIRKWINATSLYSNPKQYLKHPLYEEVKKIDDDVLFRELISCLTGDGAWQAMAALADLTGEDPVLPEHRGNVHLSASDWQKWYQKQSF